MLAIRTWLRNLFATKKEPSSEGSLDVVVAQQQTPVLPKPKPNTMITVPGHGTTYYIVDRVDAGSYGSGEKYWTAKVRESDTGQPRTLQSTDVTEWSRYQGPLTPWHQQEQEKQQKELEEKRKADEQAAFQQQFSFSDGRTVRPGMLLKVKQEAQGDLDMFSGHRLIVKDVDMPNGIVSLTPQEEEDKEFEVFLESVPAGEVIQWMEPAMAPVAEQRKVKLRGEYEGQTIQEGDLASLVPNFADAVRKGQVDAVTQVYINYKGGKGEEVFLKEMMNRGWSPQEGEYKLNNAQPKFDDKGKQINIFGPWQASLKIRGPISEEMEAELKRVAPESRIIPDRNGNVTVHSNELYRLMASLGAFESKMPKAANWIRNICKFS